MALLMGSLTITLACRAPGCRGTVRFPHDRAAAHGRRHLLGHCDTCGRAYELHGGQAVPRR